MPDNAIASADGEGGRGQLQRIQLYREKDHSGVSGVGLIAEGIVFTDGRVAIRWTGDLSSITLHNSIANVERVHGHHGGTHVVFLDQEKPDPTDRLMEALRVAVADHERTSRRIKALVKMVTGDHPRYFRGRARTRKTQA